MQSSSITAEEMISSKTCSKTNLVKLVAVKKGQIVRVDREKYLNSVEVCAQILLFGSP